MGIKPINVAAALLIIQFFLCLIWVVGIITTRVQKVGTVDTDEFGKVTALVLVIATVLASVFICVLTRDFYPVWSPILGDLTLPTIAGHTGVLLIFMLDLVTASILMLSTGGAKDSAFTAILFLIPALAIFLRESPWRFFGYAFFAGIVYVLSLTHKASVRRYKTIEVNSPSNHFAQGWVNVMCLLLTMITGYITRPLSI